MRPRRSVLYMPGSNNRAIEKARTLAVDGVILDLEDGVAPEAKDLARRQVVAALRDGGFGRREVVVRINGAGSPFTHADLDAVGAARPDAILIPKVQSPDDIRRVRESLRGRTGRAPQPLWAMIETPLAILNIRDIAEAAADTIAPLTCLVMGTNDLVKESRMHPGPDRAPLLPWLLTAIAAARAYHIDVLDGVYANLQDPAGFRAECEQGRMLGMDGKTLVHPNQIETCNAVFSPSAEDIAWARTILEAFDRPENRGKGAISVDGRMVELLHVEIGRRTLAIADAIADAGRQTEPAAG